MIFKSAKSHKYFDINRAMANKGESSVLKMSNVTYVTKENNEVMKSVFYLFLAGMMNQIIGIKILIMMINYCIYNSSSIAMSRTQRRKHLLHSTIMTNQQHKGKKVYYIKIQYTPVCQCHL